MNILVVSDFETQGGAAIAMRRVGDAIATLGHSLYYVVCRADAAHPFAASDHTDALHWRSETSTLNRLARRFMTPEGRRALDQRAVERSFAGVLERVKPDAINFSNIHNAVSAGWSDRLLPIASRFAPVCWTLHDMWSFTGRCAYAHGCERFVSGCNQQCPTATEYPAMNPALISSSWLARRAMFQKLPQLTAIAVSGWMAREAKRGLWHNHRIEVIHNGLPLNRYEQLDQSKSRAELGIFTDGPVLLAAAVDWQSPHKGGALLADCLRTMSPQRPTLLLLGSGELPGNLSGLNIVRLGFRSEQRFKSVAMSAADCLVHPATAENFSNVLLESAACGLPAAAFDVGGNAEIITDGQTGCISRNVTGGGLAEATMNTLELRKSRSNLREYIRTQAEQRFDVATQARLYLGLFQSLIDDQTAATRPRAAQEIAL